MIELKEQQLERYQAESNQREQMDGVRRNEVRRGTIEGKEEKAKVPARNFSRKIGRQGTFV